MFFRCHDHDHLPTLKPGKLLDVGQLTEVGLDPLHALAVKQELKDRSRNGTTIFMSTHLLNIAEELADRIGIIDQGKLVAHGSVDELRAKMKGTGKALENIFLELFERGEGAAS